MRKKKIGNKTFHVSGGVVTATDPCYERDLLCHRTIRNVKDGDYTCYAWRFLSDTYNENGEVVGRAYNRVGIIGDVPGRSYPP